MAIQMRRGNYNNYDPAKMLPGELAVTLQNDPRSENGKALHVSFGASDEKTLMTFEDAEGMIEDAVEEAAEQAAEQAAEEATADAVDAALKSEGFAVGKQNGTDVGSGSPYYHNNAKYYLEQAEAVAESIPEDYSELSDDVDDLKGALIVNNASGAIASFPDGGDGFAVRGLKVQIEPIQAGSGDPSPDNVRPISGRTAVTVTRTGKNLLKNNSLVSKTRNGVTITVNADGTISLNGTCSSWFFEQIYLWNGSEQLCPPGDYIISGGISNVYISIYLDNNTKVVDYTQIVSDVRFTVPQGRTIKSVRFEISANYSFSNAVMHLMIRPAIISDSVYEPYSGTTYPVTFPSSAGTVYGGTLDVTQGVLTVDRAIVDLGTLIWGKTSTSAGSYRFYSTDIESAISSISATSETADLVCTDYAACSFNEANANTNGIYEHTNKSIGIYDSSKVSMSEEDFKTAMSGVQLVYELATPQTYTLTPRQVTTLLGWNNIWSEADSVSVEYVADTKLYIEQLTEPDADMIADANITSGSYFMVGNGLYLATANIANGSAIVVGTNCTRTNLAEALNTINA